MSTTLSMPSILRPIVLAVALVGMAVPASAVIVFTGDNVVLEITAPQRVGDPASNLWRFDLLARGTAGALVGGLDGAITGTLHQQVLGQTTTPSLDEPVAGTQLLTEIDSHFLVRGSQIISVLPPTETFDPGMPSPQPPDASGDMADQAVTGFGTELRGTFALLGGGVAQWPVAQLVAPRGATIILDFELGMGGDPAPPKEIVQTSFLLDPSLLVTCGDFDFDGDVDTADLNTMLVNFSGALGPGEGDRVFEQGDCDGDMDVDTADMNSVILNWTGALAEGGPSSAVAAVPEPSGLGWLAAIAIFAAAPLRRRLVGLRARNR